ncbi:outer membrane beta-barrel protein [Hymenobacter persicinus]|uniref:PorT family protein n=1 Tax=Hymenobacter persicinus TaxID=2025506 RepID=A0A4Q5LIJ4_9BACT|nr:outer membrane beta-barrel protein [Hymenobacter persicinus]RYU82822.1 PorT family protein [Hymenobacter persicinus]
MTDHESEKFYQDLRRKLDGYGSAPPEAVWAGIRAQVPARRPRRYRPLLLLLLLGTLVIGLTFGPSQWLRLIEPAEPGQAARISSTTPLASPAAQQNRAPGLPAPAGAGSTTATEPAAAATSSALAVTSTAPLAATSGKALASGQRNIVAGPGRTGRLLLAADSRRSKRLARKYGESSAAQTGSSEELASAEMGRSRRKMSRSARLLATSRSRQRALGLEITGSRTSHSEALGRVMRRRRAAGRAVAGPEVDATESSLGETSQNTTSGRRRTRQPKISNAPLALLVVRPAVEEAAEPEVHATKRRPRKRPTKQELRLRNWSAQVLVGSGLTYRVLGGTPTQLETLERPSLGFSGQATATYAFSRQLAVAVGLGYAEYATALHYQLQKKTLETVEQKDFRDVYRFLTVPVQAQLTLGGNARWRYGVLGGGTLALLTGARTTEGSACNCQQTQWTSDAVNLPFNRTNLQLTGGAFASYQFGLGQWLTIRPQGQIFLNSLTTPASTRADRRPWSLGVQAGYSWDLDPRNKH